MCECKSCEAIQRIERIEIWMQKIQERLSMLEQAMGIGGAE